MKKTYKHIFKSNVAFTPKEMDAICDWIYGTANFVLTNAISSHFFELDYGMTADESREFLAKLKADDVRYLDEAT